MRYLFCFLVISFHSYAQNDLLSGYPQAWQGDTALFAVQQGGLKSAGLPISETIQCMKKIHREEQQHVEVSVKCDFVLSTANYVRWVIKADSLFPHFQKALVVKWNSVSNNLVLQDYRGTTITTLAESRPGIVRSGKLLKVRVFSGGGIIRWFTDSSAIGNWVEETAVQHAGVAGEWSGFVFTHTSTRASLLTVASFRKLELPLLVHSQQVITADSLRLVFTKACSLSVAPEVEGFLLRSYFWENDSSLFLVLEQPLPYWLATSCWLSSVWSASGHEELRDSVFWYVEPELRWQDLRVVEFMPFPQSGQQEYVEILNRRQDTMKLEGFKFCDASTCCTIGGYIAPGQRLVVSPSTTTGFPSLNNTGDRLRLYWHDSILLDEVLYESAWWAGHDIDGFSMELSDVNSPCSEAAMWYPSDSAGGSPGKNNTAEISRSFSATAVVNEKTLTINFSLPIPMGTDSLIISAARVSGHTINSYIWTTEIAPVFSESILSIDVAKGFSCYMGIPDTTLAVPVAWIPRAGELRITEVLFNPLPYGVDFFEITNLSSKLLWLDTLMVADSTKGYRCVIRQALRAGASVVLTPDTLWASMPGRCSYLLIKTNLPSIPDEGTYLRLYSDSSLMEDVWFSEEYHSALIDDPEGVSLERIQYHGPWQYQWTSCVKGQNPGCYEIREAEEGADWVLSGRIISPDGDARDDNIQISWQGSAPVIRAYIDIYTMSGVKVKNLASGHLLSKGGFVLWEGESGSSVMPNGWYIVQAIAETDGGLVQRRKIISVIRSQ